MYLVAGVWVTALMMPAPFSWTVSARGFPQDAHRHDAKKTTRTGSPVRRTPLSALRLSGPTPTRRHASPAPTLFQHCRTAYPQGRRCSISPSCPYANYLYARKQTCIKPTSPKANKHQPSNTKTSAGHPTERVIDGMSPIKTRDMRGQLKKAPVSLIRYFRLKLCCVSAQPH